MKFSNLAVPALEAGPGCVCRVPAAIHAMGVSRVMMVTGCHFRDGPARATGRESIESGLLSAGIGFGYACVRGEPSPELVDGISEEIRKGGYDGVLAIGGGSALDAGKAAAAGACLEGSIFEYLEAIGSRESEGRRLPLVCVPTTAGTGSEATKNAVLSRPGPVGFKKSIRHENYIPDRVFLDPELQASCPPTVTAASGMDTVTQLLESWLSSASNPFTDALALSGLGLAARALPRVMEEGSDLGARQDMAYAAFLSGICLANAGLGAVHGMAGALGGLSSIPHGVACGTLLSTTLASLSAVAGNPDRGDPAASARFFSRMRAAASVICPVLFPAGPEEASAFLIGYLEGWTRDFGIGRLGTYGIGEDEIMEASVSAGNKSALIALSPEELAAIMRSRL